MTISRATNLLYTPPWQPIMHFNWTSSSRHCFSAAEIFHFGLIRIHSNARNSIPRAIYEASQPLRQLSLTEGQSRNSTYLCHQDLPLLLSLKARLHRRFLSLQLDASFVALKLHQVSNMLETHAISRRQIARALKITPGLHVRL